MPRMLTIRSTTPPVAVAAPIRCCAEPAPAARPFKISELTQAVNRVAYLTQAHPSWTRAKVRRTVARELNVSTVQLRYLLRKAAEQGL